MTNTIIQEIDQILRRAFWALPVSGVEYHYQQRNNLKSLDYKRFGVDNINDLFYKLDREGKVVLFKKPESNEPYVMSVRVAEQKRQGYLKFHVKELLDKHSGDIPFSKFESYYNAHSTLEWNSDYFGFNHNDLDQLCDVLKDIVTVEVNSSGEKMMKAVHRDFSPQAAVTWKIEEKKALLLKKRESKTTYVMSVSEKKQKGYLKFVVKELLNKNGGEIKLCSFEGIYKDIFKVEWKSHYFGLNDIDHLSDVLKDIVMVEVNSSGEKVMKVVNKDSSGENMINLVDEDSPGKGAYSVRRRKIESFYALLDNPNTCEINEVLERCPMGIAMSELSLIETSYQRIHRKSPDWKSLGVQNIQEHFLKLGEEKMVVLLEKPESKEKYVMSSPVAEWKHKGLLKYIVKELLDEYDQIPFRFFEDFYVDKVEVEWDSFDYGLTDLDQLCGVLNDIVTVEVRPSGTKVMMKVMKAVNKALKKDI